MTLESIVSGVDEANLNNPRFRLVGASHNDLGEGTYAKFDVALTVEENKNFKGEVEGGIGNSLLKIASLNLDANGAYENKNNVTQRLAFEVFVAEKNIQDIKTNDPNDIRPLKKSVRTSYR